MRAPSLILAILLPLSLVACAKKKEEQFTNPIYTIPTDTLSAAQKIAANPNILCADPEGKCNPAVGMFTHATGEGAGVCTATLVSEDIVVTNSHCIPEDLKVRGASCKNRIWLTFPSFPGRPDFDRQARCQEMLFVSDIEDENGEARPDFAFFRLEKRMNRPPLSLSRAGFSDGEQVTITAVDPSFVNRVATGSMHTMKCKTVYGSEFLPAGAQQLADLMVFSDCKVIKGNSGSAIRAADGSLRGVIQAFFNTNGTADRLRKRGIQLVDGTIDNINVGTSMACLDEVPLGGLKNPACAARKGLEDLVDERRARDAERLQKSFDEILARKLPLRQLRWTNELRQMEQISNSGERTLRTFADVRPFCVRAGEMAQPRFTQVNLRIPQVELVRGADRYLRESRRLLETGAHNGGNLNIETIEAGRRYQAKLEVTLGEAAHRPENFDQEIPVCP